MGFSVLLLWKIDLWVYIAGSCSRHSHDHPSALFIIYISTFSGLAEVFFFSDPVMRFIGFSRIVLFTAEHISEIQYEKHFIRIVDRISGFLLFLRAYFTLDGWKSLGEDRVGKGGRGMWR